MKKILSFILCASALIAVSCVNDKTAENDIETKPTSDKGAVNLNIVTRENQSTDAWDLLRIFKGDSTSLVRKYKNGTDTVPEYIWLVADTYIATVECGTANKKTYAQFDENFYYVGSKKFTLTGGQVADIELVAVRQNIPVKVALDATITNATWKSGEEFKVEVWGVDANGDATTDVLTYTENKTGYFLMPENCTTLNWAISGTYVYVHQGDTLEKVIAKSGAIENVALQHSYTLSFTYSPDAPGYMGGIEVEVDTKLEEKEWDVAFSPDPVVEGVGFDYKVSYDYITGSRQYKITSPSNLNSLSFMGDGVTYDAVATTVSGVAIDGLNTTTMMVTLSDDFFNMFRNGQQSIKMTVGDIDGGAVTAELPYVLFQGAKIFNAAGNFDLWNRVGPAYVSVHLDYTTVEIGCREQGTSTWTKYTATTTGADETYSAQLSDICAGHTYEYTMFADGKQIGGVRTFTTDAGNQIPNGDLEDWCTNSDGAVIPFSSAEGAYWSTGNEAIARMLKGTNLTLSSTDVRPGSTGRLSAYLDSQNVMNIKFAAGNIYVGSFGGMSGMADALVNFGQPFTYNAKPKAIRFWVKYNCGSITSTGSAGVSKGDPDLTKIFCCMCDWTGPHTVDSAEPDATTFSPDDAAMKSGDARYNGVLYSAYMDSTVSQTSWKQVEIPFTFYGTDSTKVPNYLVLTFSCSGYGDYFAGSDDSWMYIDDIELVY